MTQLSPDPAWERLGPWAIKILALAAAVSVATPVALLLAVPFLA